MKFRFKGKRRIEIAGLGIVEPGQEFDCHNPAYRDTFETKYLFEKVDGKKAPKQEKKEEAPKIVKED